MVFRWPLNACWRLWAFLFDIPISLFPLTSSPPPIDVNSPKLIMSDAPKAEGGEDPKETITIRVRDQTGEETFFKVKKSTRMEKVFSTYAQRKGVSMGALRFLLDGERVAPDTTPKALDLEDQDQIDCMLEQQGGVALGI
ncbi:unnamed protein product [Discosporangium mesarthrocarpum]